MSNLPIYSGGMMRCCIEEIRKYAGRSTDGLVIHCRTCHAPLRVRNGAWEWSCDHIPETASNQRLDGEAA